MTTIFPFYSLFTVKVVNSIVMDRDVPLEI